MLLLLSLLYSQQIAAEANAQQLLIHHFSYGYEQTGLPLVTLTLTNSGDSVQTPAIDVTLTKAESSSQNSYEEEQIGTAKPKGKVHILPHKSAVVSLYADTLLEAGDYKALIRMKDSHSNFVNSFDFTVSGQEADQAKWNLKKHHQTIMNAEPSSSNRVWQTIGILTFSVLLLVIGVIAYQAIKDYTRKIK